MIIRTRSPYSALNSVVKADARAALMGQLKTAVGANISYALLRFVIRELAGAFIPAGTVYGTILTEVVYFIGALLLGVFTYGLFYIYINLEYDQPVTVNDLFTGFRKDSPDRIIKVQAFLSALEILCMVPFDLAWNLSGGIRARGFGLFMIVLTLLVGAAALVFFMLNYGLSFLVLIDFRELEPRQVPGVSAKLVRGHRKELFFLVLSFAPLYIAGLLSFGLANLWVNAYFLSALTAFYRRLTGTAEDPLG